MTGRDVAERTSGRPLFALAGVLMCWFGVRAMFVEMPGGGAPVLRDAPHFVRIASSAPPAVSGAATARIRLPTAAPTTAGPLRASVESGRIPPRSAPSLGVADVAAQAPLPLPPRAVAQAPRLAGGHNLLWMAAMQGLPLPSELASVVSRAIGNGDQERSEGIGPSLRRWSGDVWLALRQGTAGLASRPSLPLYGASQTGAVLRFDLRPGSPRRPQAYVRAVHALGGRTESDLAAGFAARPLAQLPLTAHLQARASRRSGRTDIRPAAFLSTGFDEVALPFGAQARGYGQAGYVGGRDATAFADGSFVAERVAFGGERTSFGAGAGVWGGAQRGAARLDLGPSASLRFQLGEGTGRIAVDYRLRVAGNAEPRSGVALTLSAGF